MPQTVGVGGTLAAQLTAGIHHRAECMAAARYQPSLIVGHPLALLPTWPCSDRSSFQCPDLGYPLQQAQPWGSSVVSLWLVVLAGSEAEFCTGIPRSSGVTRSGNVCGPQLMMAGQCQTGARGYNE
ncbi:hypothetical protein KIL84_022729 [Mauremys mutica]|uniref:Uncharacterized protein n=1 Tax=Mauremys mutica TaxID=74926 RepID=A0A9D3WQC6_9SAUR|nr:hypothetical protein KIL84_022729 [Mauremys mutica]